MMTVLIVGLVGALGTSLLVFALSLSRQKGTLTERLERLEKDSAIDKKRAEIIAEARTDDETIDRLDNGSF